jgi:hypothetical protein
MSQPPTPDEASAVAAVLVTATGAGLVTVVYRLRRLCRRSRERRRQDVDTEHRRLTDWLPMLKSPLGPAITRDAENRIIFLRAVLDGTGGRHRAE